MKGFLNKILKGKIDKVVYVKVKRSHEQSERQTINWGTIFSTHQTYKVLISRVC